MTLLALNTFFQHKLSLSLPHATIVELIAICRVQLWLKSCCAVCDYSRINYFGLVWFGFMGYQPF